jgi:uncharacterized protein DUF6791
MSQRLVSLNPDLSRLLAEGLDIVIGNSKHLFVCGVPYVNAAKEIKHGTIASVLDLAGETTVPPESHVVFFVGEPRCNEHGSALPGVSQNTNYALGERLGPTTRSPGSPQQDRHARQVRGLLRKDQAIHRNHLQPGTGY